MLGCAVARCGASVSREEMSSRNCSSSACWSDDEVSDEVRAARKLVLELQQQSATARQLKKLKREQNRKFHLHQDKLGRHPTRDEPLGADRTGRRYWSFVNDRERLWVEAPRDEGGEPQALPPSRAAGSL